MRKSFFKLFLPWPLLSFYHFVLAFAGAFFYGFPCRKLIVVGVTGTNGKSTVVEMCHQILREANFKVASVSSIRFKINQQEWRNELKMTMPGRFRLQKFLRNAFDSGCRYAVVEVTSEGIKQHRHRFIDFDVAIFTNLAPEHIEAHGGFENYREAKERLFAALGGRRANSKKRKSVAIVNGDDPYAEYFLRFPADEKWCYGIEAVARKRMDETQKILLAKNIQSGLDGTFFMIGDTEFHIPLLGDFNVYNALAAICMGLSQSIPLETIQKALQSIRAVPGRMEVVARQPFLVIVDYAHTPDSLKKVYEVISELQSPKFSSKLICVLGAAGGGRDKWKRCEMGKIASQFCSQIILTNEDPYEENPEQIIHDIESGISNFQNLVFKILDRREAIFEALKNAEDGDKIVITGKGCEPWMCVGGNKKIPWDDRRIVLEELEKMGAKGKVPS